MDKATATLIAKGLITYVPGYLSWHRKYRLQPPSGTLTAEYCYSVWLRHLVLAGQSGLNTDPEAVGELGPGASLGVGICALLTGANTYYGLDAAHYANRTLSAGLIPELVEMLKQRTTIPGAGSHKPELESVAFPADILTDERLDAALRSDRVEAITRAVLNGEADGISVHYVAPWDDPSIVPAQSLDMILSQAVLEHVDALPPIYSAMYHWLRPGGFISHQIDYKSHETSTAWDGHWAYSDFVWELLNGKRPKVINRLPHSSHMSTVEDTGLTMSKVIMVKTEPTLSRAKLAPRFAQLTDADLACSGAFIQAYK